MRDFIIDDSTPVGDLFHPDRGRGLDLTDRPRGYVYGDVAEPFPTAFLIPRSEWQARIEEMEAQRSRISDLCDVAGLTVKDQKSTNYCWANATVHCLEIVRVIQNEPTVRLSAASVAAPLTHFRNVGGFGPVALQYVIDHGAVPEAQWPNTAIDSDYDTPANRELATHYRVQKWYEGEPGNLDQLISALLLGIPCNLGYTWWGHQVTGVDPVWLDGAVALRIDNSWGTGWGTNGRGVLQGRRMLPDDITMPRTAFAA